jgi:Alpha-2-macroglobulin bait region domain
VNENLKFNIQSVVGLSHVFYQIISKGDVVVSDYVRLNNKKIFEIEVKASYDMIPRAKMVVHYFSKAGEIISDSIIVEFKDQLRNFVSLT